MDHRPAVNQSTTDALELETLLMWIVFAALVVGVIIGAHGFYTIFLSGIQKVLGA